MLMCEMVGDDARQEGLCVIDTLHDATNAVASATQAAYPETIRTHGKPIRRPVIAAAAQGLYRLLGG